MESSRPWRGQRSRRFNSRVSTVCVSRAPMLEGRPSGIVVCNVPTDTLGNGHRTRVSAGLHVCDPRAARRPGVGAALPAERAAWLDEPQEASSGIPGAVPPPRRRQLSRPRADPRLRLRSGSHRRQLDRHRAVRRPHVIHRFHVLSGAGTWYGVDPAPPTVETQD